MPPLLLLGSSVAVQQCELRGSDWISGNPFGATNGTIELNNALDTITIPRGSVVFNRINVTGPGAVVAAPGTITQRNSNIPNIRRP